MEFEATEPEPETARSTPSRREKSLGLLTMKFVGLLQQAADGRLDLKVVGETGVLSAPVVGDLFFLFFFVLFIFRCFGATFQMAAANKGLSISGGAGQVH